MIENLKLTATRLQRGCGIYYAGDTDKCAAKLFVTERGEVLLINHRVDEGDLMTVFQWGIDYGRNTPVEDTHTDGDEEIPL